MKQALSIFAVVLLLAGCGQLGEQIKKNMETGNALRAHFETGTVTVTTNISGNGSSEIETGTSALGKRLGFDNQRVAIAMAVKAQELGAAMGAETEVKIDDGAVKNVYKLSAAEIASYAASAASANRYLSGMLAGNKDALLKDGDATYLGEDQIGQVLNIATQQFSKTSNVKLSRLAGILDTNIDNTQIPVHAVTYWVELSNGETKNCTFFVQTGDGHKVAGFDIR
ncbi:MAG: hypothetical protein IM638_07405 [Bacteroidetes bacterium]|nr:hypothetical protein [Bacteroidota bacterium]